MTSFGPGSAFGSFATTTASTRAPRRTTSGKEERTSPNGLASTTPHGPQPSEGQGNPSLGSWSTPHELPREGESAEAQQRSFSSILAPVLPTDNRDDALDPAKPFVYSREFLLSLYDDDKRNRRPLELARHDIATTDHGTVPWALTEYREGEKEVSFFFISTPSPHRSALHTASAIHRQIGHLIAPILHFTQFSLRNADPIPRATAIRDLNPSPYESSQSYRFSSERLLCFSAQFRLQRWKSRPLLSRAAPARARPHPLRQRIKRNGISTRQRRIDSWYR